MSNRFDLEQSILDCWNITTDIDNIYEYIMNTPTEKVDQDRIANMLLGVRQLYDLKFSKTFDKFEECIRSRDL